ncbi:MAG: DUF72 domain-containing protein, partial [Myxococcales bacterium]|nr:DUF72 domain-containing protein [Myxococcales bacterium]
MRIVTGTSGFAYAHWKGPFYPADLATDALLGHYAARLPAVEINNTFYRMPRREMLAGWAAATPPGFRFVLKASQRITHHARLVDAGDSVRYLAGQAEALGPKLGGLLFQLPPYLRADGADEARLAAFLAVLPPGVPAAIEFRHESWYTETTFALLRAHGVALVTVDWAEDEDAQKAAPLLATARHAYLRLRKSRYRDDELAGWVERLLRLGCEEAQIFFKDDDAGEAPDAAARLLRLAARAGAEVPGPLVPFE